MSLITPGKAWPVVIGLVGLSAIFGSLYAWRTARIGGGAPPVRPPALVSVIRVQPRSGPDELQAVGSLEAAREVMVAPDTAGRVTAIHFSAGQIVQEGAPVVQLHDAPEQADRAALARADSAQLQLRRSQELASGGPEPRVVRVETRPQANHIPQHERLSRIEAIERAAAVRMLPVLMTTAAMVAGLVPLLLTRGAGSASWFSIGVVVVMGMLIGTFFTLLVLPTIYSFLAEDHRAAAESPRTRELKSAEVFDVL